MLTGKPAKRGAQTLSQWDWMACGMHARKSDDVGSRITILRINTYMERLPRFGATKEKPVN